MYWDPSGYAKKENTQNPACVILESQDDDGVEGLAIDSKGGSDSSRPNQVHNFASNKSSKYTSQFENIAKKYNLDLDEAWNKELMPHQGRHAYAR